MKDKDKPAANKNTNDNAELKKTAAAKKSVTPAPSKDEKLNKPTLSSRILLILLVFIAGVSLTVYLMPSLQERLPFIADWVGGNASDDVASLNQRIDAQQNEITVLRTRTADLENTLANLPENVSTIIPVEFEERIAALESVASAAQSDAGVIEQPVTDTSQSARIDMLLSRMSQLEASFVPLSQNMLNAGEASQERERLAEEAAFLNEKLANLENRLVSVEQVAAKDNSGILLNLKIADLKRSFESGNPYAADIAAIEQIIEGGALAGNSAASAAITTLKQNADMGAVTVGQSARDFNALIPELLKEEGIDPDASWMQNTWSGLKNMVTVRQTNGSAPTASELDNMIAQIELYLLERNPKTAVSLVDRLPAQLSAVLSAWRSDAQATIDGSDAIISLERLATDSYLFEGANTPMASEGAS